MQHPDRTRQTEGTIMPATRAHHAPRSARNALKTHGAAFLVAFLVSAAAGIRAQAPKDQGPNGKDPQAIVNDMVAHEDYAAAHRQNFAYTSIERSERTGGQSWTERVVETNAGKVRLLLAVAGQPVSPDRMQAERSRLQGIAADPSEFIREEKSRKNDDDKAKAMLDLLPKAFIVENPRVSGHTVTMDFHPNPEYQTQSNEEKVLHGMSGTLTIDTTAMRLSRIHASLPKDISVGFGLASIHAGSSFETARVIATPGEWKTSLVDTNINGKAILFKSLGKNEHVERSNFTLLPNAISVPDAVAMAMR